MKIFRFSLFVLPLLLLAGCSTVTTAFTTTKRDFDKNAKFDRYKTYAWAPEPSTLAFANPTMDQAIHAAVDKGLSARGFTKVQGKAPDFYVVYHVTAVQKTDVRHYTDWGFGAAYRPGNGFYLGWPGTPATYVMLDQNPVGAFILDFVEVRRNQLVWRGVASSVVSNNADANAIRTTEAVNMLLSKFPPPALPPKP